LEVFIGSVVVLLGCRSAGFAGGDGGFHQAVPAHGGGVGCSCSRRRRWLFLRWLFLRWLFLLAAVARPFTLLRFRW
jgi:hypothetical protein